MAGNATVLAPSSSATRRDSVWLEARSFERSSVRENTGPTVWTTHVAVGRHGQGLLHRGGGVEADVADHARVLGAGDDHPARVAEPPQRIHRHDRVRRVEPEPGPVPLDEILPRRELWLVSLARLPRVAR